MTTIAKKFRRKFIRVYNGRIFRKRYIRRVTLGNKLGALLGQKFLAGMF